MTAESTSQKRLGSVLFYGIVALLAYLVYLVVAPFLQALAWAIVFVIVAFPAYRRLVPRLGSTLAAVLATAGVTLILIVPALLIANAFVRQGFQAAQEIQSEVASGRFHWVNELWARIQSRFPEATSSDLSTLLHQYAESAAGYLAAQIGTILRHMAVFLFHLSVTILAMFYLFRDGEALVERIREVLPFEVAHRDRMLREAHDLVFASVASTFVAAIFHGVAGGFAFGLAGIHAPVFWGVMMGFFSLVPVVGTALIWVPAAVSLMIQGHIVKGLLLVAFCGIIVGLGDNFIRPWVISGRAQMGGLIVFISVLGGISVFGMLGIVLGPIIVASAASLLELYSPSASGRNARA